jgi:hypothetical protein
VGKGRLKERCGLKLRTNFFPFKKSPKTECELDSRIYGMFQIMERLSPLDANQLSIWTGVEYLSHLKHHMSFRIHYQKITHTECTKWFPESEQFQVTSLHNDDTLSLLWGRVYNFQNWIVTLPLPNVSWHIDPLNAPIEPMVKSSGFPCLLDTVLVGTSLPTVAAVPAQINWHIKT